MNKYFGALRILLIPLDISVILLLCIWLFTTPTGLNSSVGWTCITIFYLYFFMFCVNFARVRKKLPISLSIEVSFSLFYFLLFFGPYQSDLLGGLSYSISKFLPNTYPAGANQALLAATIGYVAFHLGTVLPRKVYPSGTDQWDENPHAYKAFDWLFSFILFSSMAIFKILGLQSSDVDRYSDAANHTQRAQQSNTIADGIYNIIILFCILALSRLVSRIARGQGLNFAHWLMAICVALWSVMILIQGDRNNFFMIALAALCGVGTFKYRVRWPVIVVMMASALTLYQAVEILRMMPEPSVSAFSDAWQRHANQGNGDSSLGNTTATLRATFEITPKLSPYAWGYYKLVGFGGIFPFIRGFFITPGAGFVTSADALTYFMIGPSAGWNVGSNLLSDIYMDFGLPGIIILMTVTGYFVVRVRTTIIKRGMSTKRIFVYMVLAGTMTEMPRYSLDFPVRFLVWGFVILFIYEKLFLGSFRREQHQTTLSK
ncbi:O-antigen polysaccharide polymerase Wzy [Sphingomonas panacis]|nr:O-antigen polysaccharide polymerase Wzy [Sphingomonas panacis]